jgi:cation diffusion facilitator CzcD-associated flavoprotein CzcO
MPTHILRPTGVDAGTNSNAALPCLTVQAHTDFPIAIIGAGFAGIGAAIQLIKAGLHSFTIFERGSEIGGTWRDNTYPGAACDVPSHVYSLSFEQNPNWSRRYATSREIQDYLLSVVEKWKLRDQMRLQTEIVEARFDEESGTWLLTTSTGDAFVARAVIAGVGGLVDPSYPDIAGMEEFEGEMMHTARWNHDVDLSDKRVAVVGTGASAVQVVPSIAPIVAMLSVFQRTPAWVVPKFDYAYPRQLRKFLARFPVFLRVSRFVKYWASELRGPIVFFNSKLLSAIGVLISKWNLRRQVEDAELRKRLTPDFQFGCKRVLVSDDYWAAFERENVELLIDPIEAIERKGVRTKDGRLHEADAIVLATGFMLGLASAPFPIIGREGRTLDEAWKDGAVAYKGMTVSGFPNWFIMMGPNTGPGHTSVLVYTEAQISHALQAIQKIVAEDLKFMDIRQELQDEYNARIQKRMKHMVWSGCKSWYLNADGSNHSLYPGFAFEYTLRARKLNPDDYELTTY